MNSVIFDLNDKQAENSLSERLEKKNGLGEGRIKLELKNASSMMPRIFDLDIDIFSKIKEIQELPDWVIIKLLLADSNLSGSDFKKRLFNE